jgi:hypothetical protein
VSDKNRPDQKIGAAVALLMVAMAVDEEARVLEGFLTNPTG